MTVKEMKELLNTYPDNMEIKINTYISNEGYDDFGTYEDLNVNKNGIKVEKDFKTKKQYLLLNWEF